MKHTIDDIVELLDAAGIGVDIQTDNEGQYVIYTGLYERSDH